MQVYALVGSSGTGKSHHSMWVSKKYNIDCMIDDGLLIGHNRIIAGKSAKREPTKIASVKRAIFTSPNHVQQVKSAILENGFKSILIIGTSVKMVTQIARVLDLLPINQIININEVSTPEEIELAKSIRYSQGKHVIPVPTFEVKKHFSGYFMHPVELLLKRRAQTLVEEKTVMRPTYSYLGNFEIADKVISDICVYEAALNTDVHKVMRIITNPLKNKSINIEVDLSLYYPNNIPIVASEIARQMRVSVENFTALNVDKMIINVKSIYVVANKLHKKG